MLELRCTESVSVTRLRVPTLTRSGPSGALRRSHLLDVEERRNGPQSVSRGSLITTPGELMGFKRIQSVGGRH